MPDFTNHSPAARQILVFAAVIHFTEPSPALWSPESSLGINAHTRLRPAPSACLEPPTNSARSSCGAVHRSSRAESGGWLACGRPLAHKIQLRYVLPVPFQPSLEFPRQPLAGQTGTPGAQPRSYRLPKNRAAPAHLHFETRRATLPPGGSPGNVPQHARAIAPAAITNK